MIRFVDLTEAYWGGDEENVRENPCCAFLDTVTDQFIRDATGCHVFCVKSNIDYIYDTGIRNRCTALVPEGFWK